jgi:hypothetical protein
MDEGEMDMNKMEEEEKKSASMAKVLSSKPI